MINMAASGGLLSIRVLTRLGMFLELKSQHLGEFVCNPHRNIRGNERCISCFSSSAVLETNQIVAKHKLKFISLSKQCLPHISYCGSCLSSHAGQSISLHNHTPFSFNSSNRNLHHTPSAFNNSSKKDTIISEDFPDPFQMVESEMANLPHDIKSELKTSEPLLRTMSHYYFNGKGKSFRPLVALLMAKACNIHTTNSDTILWTQKIVAMVSEMIHTASLVHDDVIDCSDTRRSQTSLNRLHGQRQSILTGDYILSQASIALANIGNPRVICILSSILEDLVSGEFMQLGSKEDENERFAHYLKKTFKKTASLIANTCKAAAILSDCNEEVVESAFQYGRNLGIAFQLVDDLLDFTSCESDMGKPTAADLKLGLATAPVLFAAQEYPQLHPLIMRRFSQPEDVEHARHLVAKSNGVEQTRILASQHSKAAIRNMEVISESNARKGLVQLARILLDRKK